MCPLDESPSRLNLYDLGEPEGSVRADKYPRIRIRIRLRSGPGSSLPVVPADPPAGPTNLLAAAPSQRHRSRRRAILLLPIALVTIAMCWDMVDLLVLYVRGVHTVAIVESYTPQTGYGKSEKVSSARLRFVDRQGQGWLVDVENVPPTTAGQTIDVVYDPQAPYVIRVKGATFPGQGTWFITSFFLFMAAVVVQFIVLGRKPSPWGTLLGMLIGWLVVALSFVVVLLV
jgi:hypothetical protein